ncbi:hypothetical protein NC652_033677 [Populus alba x Populus x berolinensis]|nr:hypothetical protein NC652_033677 [Populus alba x Populus x berolinensis]
MPMYKCNRTGHVPRPKTLSSLYSKDMKDSNFPPSSFFGSANFPFHNYQVRPLKSFDTTLASLSRRERLETVCSYGKHDHIPNLLYQQKQQRL